MLRHTFCHLPGVGLKKEQKLWNAGVDSWESFLGQCAAPEVRRFRNSWTELLEESQRCLDEQQPEYFASRLPTGELWRLFKEFRRCCAYLDIETTGLGRFGDYITTIALYDGRNLRSYVRGRNLDDFAHDVQEYKLLITYNGTTFDLPFLRRQFHLALDQAHIDLRYLLRGLGLRGGLKQCEKQAGITRPPGMKELNGYAAVLLWNEYRRKRDEKALETLLAYNVQDTLNLESLMHKAFNCRLRETPFARLHELPPPVTPKNPYTADAERVAKVTSQMNWVIPFRR